MITDADSLTRAVLREVGRAANPRLREIMGLLVTHLHAFVREARLSEAEFRQASALIARLGQLTNAQHNEVVLMAGGIVTAAVGSAYKQDTVTGVGLGLSTEAAGLLLFDIFAARRALRFTESLERPLQTAGATH